VIERLGDETGFGSPRAFWVSEIRGDWFGIVTPELPNGRLGWIRDDRTRLDVSQTRYWLLADRSDRLLSLYYGNRLLNRYGVTVGAPGTETPLGAFAITDALAGRGLGPYYGCCALALSGHQPNLPSGWIGGDRMAIHGTPGAVGAAESAGCLRTTDETMVSLFARVPLGAPVYVRP
jgi:lipoprotein-anchoring transpeptidase ErfK/SrfK